MGWYGGISGGGGGGMSIGGAVTSGTTGSVLFIDGSGNLGQNNPDFFWDNTNHVLKLEGPGQLQVYNVDDHAGNYERGVLDWTTTSNILTVGVPPSGAGGTGTLRDTRFYSAGLLAMYRVANGNGDNWFEGDAGNFSVTGYRNFGTGHGSLGGLTSGFQNTGIGYGALFSCSDGNNNTAIGNFALISCTHGVGNFAMGNNALGALTSGNGNTAVGSASLQAGLTITENTAVGSNIFSALGNTGTSDNGNVGIGNTSFNALAIGGGNVGIGVESGLTMTGGGVGSNGNLLIGFQAGRNMTGANSWNTIMGVFSGKNLTGAQNITIIGAWPGPSASVSNVIAINDGNGGGFTYNVPALDWNYTNANVWSFHRSTVAQGLHVYNTFDDAVPSTNYERACLDWNLTSNVFRLASQKGGTGTVRLIAIDGFSKAGAPAAGDLPSGTFALIDDTSANQTWLCFNKAGTIRKVQLI